MPAGELEQPLAALGSEVATFSDCGGAAEIASSRISERASDRSSTLDVEALLVDRDPHHPDALATQRPEHRHEAGVLTGDDVAGPQDRAGGE